MEKDLKKAISIIANKKLRETEKLNQIKAILMEQYLKKAINTITSKELGETEKVNQLRAILEENPNIVHSKISKNTFESIGPIRDNVTLLHFIARLNCVDVAKLLIEKGANVNAVSDNAFEETPLHEAAFHGNKEVAELFLECNANINSKDHFGSVPLHNAASVGSEEVVKLLLEKGADVNAVTSDYSDHRETPLHQTIVNSHIGKYIRTIKMLLDYGANTEIEDLRNGTPLYRAVSFGRAEATKLLLEAKANANARNKRGETPLHVTVNGGLDSLSEGCEIAERLLKHGADVHAKDENGNTPLHFAALQRSKGVVKLLLEYGANINETNNSGITALKMIVCHGELWDSVNDRVDPKPTVKILIEQTLKNNPSMEKPEFMKKQGLRYSEYWDKCQLEGMNSL